jgi:hypothetical protein
MLAVRVNTNYEQEQMMTELAGLSAFCVNTNKMPVLVEVMEK